MATVVGNFSFTFKTGQGPDDLINNYMDIVDRMPELMEATLEQLADDTIDVAIPLTRIDTGRLVKSYQKTPIYVTGNAREITVFNDAHEEGKKSYAAANEYGNQYMAPRLMLTTGLEQVSQNMDEEISKALIKILKGG